MRLDPPLKLWWQHKAKITKTPEGRFSKNYSKKKGPGGELEPFFIVKQSLAIFSVSSFCVSTFLMHL